MNIIAKTALALILLVSVTARAQQVRETTIKKGKEHIPAFSVKFRHGRSETQDAMESFIRSAGLKKAKHKKGYTQYKGVVWPAISNSKMDYYYKLKGNKRKTTLYFIASKGYDNYVTSAADPATAATITSMLQMLDQEVARQQAITQKEKERDDLEQQKKQKEKEIQELQNSKK